VIETLDSTWEPGGSPYERFATKDRRLRSGRGLSGEDIRDRKHSVCGTRSPTDYDLVRH
jgi:hypothetical protein